VKFAYNITYNDSMFIKEIKGHVKEHVKMSKSINLLLIAQKNLMFKIYNARVTKEYYCICILNMCLC
jgi:hypothetical protein